MGVLEAINKREGGFTDGDVAILSVTAAHAAIAINNARLLRATKQALEKVKVTNQIKNNFLALASHELRTPLTAIKEGISLLIDRLLGPLNEEQNDFLTTVDQNIDRLTELLTAPVARLVPTQRGPSR